jgi:hypothetical protein
MGVKRGRKLKGGESGSEESGREERMVETRVEKKREMEGSIGINERRRKGRGEKEGMEGWSGREWREGREGRGEKGEYLKCICG